MKNVMKRAWEIYRELTGDHTAKLSMSLRQAWAEKNNAENNNVVKDFVLSSKASYIAKLNLIVDSSCTHHYCDLYATMKDWANYGKDRTYFSIVESSNNHKISKRYVTKEYGYYDNISNIYVPGKNDLNRDFTFNGTKLELNSIVITNNTPTSAKTTSHTALCSLCNEYCYGDCTA